MKHTVKSILALMACVSFSSIAGVNVHVHRDVAPLLINGVEVGYSFTKKSLIELEDGVNQIVVRVEKLVSKQGEKEKFNSQPVVLNLNASDSDLYLTPGTEITRPDQAAEFNKRPYISVKDASGNEVKVTQGILPNLGGITRDYEKELAKYNLNTGFKASNSEVQVQGEAIKSTASAMPNEMVEYWFLQATQPEKTEFTDWAFKNRKNFDVSIDSESKALQMLSYWYSQADKDQRAQIISWLVSQ